MRTNMIKRIILTFLIIMINTGVFAKERVIDVTVDYLFSSMSEVNELIPLAREQARFLASEELGTYLKSNTEINLNVLTKDEVLVLASNVLEAEADYESFRYACVNKENNINKLIYTVTFKADDSEFVKKVDLLKKKDAKYLSEVSDLIKQLKSKRKKDKEIIEKNDVLINDYLKRKNLEVELGLERLDDAIKMSKLEEIALKAYHSGNYVLATLCLKKEADLDKKNHRMNQATILGRLAYSYALQYDYEQAKFYYKEALKESPKFSYAASGLSDIYMVEHNYVDAKKCLEIAVADITKKYYIVPDGIKLACTYMAFNEDEKALTALNDAEQNLNYALPADKNKLKRIINDLRKNLIWLISSKKKWNVDMDSWQKDYHSRIKDSYIEYYKLDIDKNTYMIVNLTTNSKNSLQSYDWIGFTVFRDDGEFTTILEGETHST